jgi:exodeoxyribonuclease V alpha subunit
MGRKRLEEVTLIFQRERIRFAGSDTAILECKPENGEDGLPSLVSTIVKCECQPGEMVQSLSYRFYGTWTTHEKYGRQFHARTFVRTQPHGRLGVMRYLTQAPHVGQKTACVLWDKFGGDAVRILREQPDVAVAAVSGSHFSQAKAEEAAAFLAGEQALEGTTIDLMELFAGRGFPRNTGKIAVEEFGNKAAELLRKNPYLLMRFRGCGFLRCDQLYQDLGGDPAKLKRQALCAWYAIARDTNGDTWHQPVAVERGLREMIAGATVRPVDAVRLGLRGKMLAGYRDERGGLWLADKRKADNEATVAARVKEWLASPPAWPPVHDIDASDHQREKAAEALVAPIAVITGGPGTGKTYLSARVIGRIGDTAGLGKVAVAAPTGKAAVRITEAMQRYGINLRARTIHSLLGVDSHSHGGGWSFKHDENNPLDYAYIIVDEASMIDTDLAAALFRACGKGTHVLLVGDTGQLPPVGHGAPLRDLIAAGVPTGELTEIRRNSGAIVEACHKIRGGAQFSPCPVLRPGEGENLKLLPAVSASAAIEQIVKTIRAVGVRGLANPIWDCQVVVAVNARSELSRKAINQRLQNELNPGGERVAGNPFRVGDKIVCLKNGFYPVVDDAPAGFNESAEEGKVFVANGEQAEVKHVEHRLTIVQMDAPARLIKIPRGAGGSEENESGSQGAGGDGDNSDESADTGCQWDLAYGISCHKAQGSEWPVVLVVLDEYPGARMVCSREWLYTALSRAKTACFLVGKLSTGHAMIGRQAIRNRKTFLVERIKEEEKEASKP